MNGVNIPAQEDGDCQHPLMYSYRAFLWHKLGASAQRGLADVSASSKASLRTTCFVCRSQTQRRTPNVSMLCNNCYALTLSLQTENRITMHQLASESCAQTPHAVRISSAKTTRRQRCTTLVCASLLMILGTLAQAQAQANDSTAFVITDADFYGRDTAKEKLGQLLMFDKILSGNRNISCATCHHPFTGTGDGLSLPVGEGGEGLGVTRNTGLGQNAIHARVPRNAPPLFNLGAREFSTLFHDGRVALDASEPSGFLSPAGDALPLGLDNVLAVQAMFPVQSDAEMAGQAGENPIADAAAVGKLAGVDGVWELLAQRLRGIDEYVDLFIDAFADVTTAADITYVHAANAIAAFEASAFRCSQSPFDRFVADGLANWDALSEQALRGGYLFYVDAGCANCHSGKFQTDHQFHAIGVPQIGPGKGDSSFNFDDGHDDFGRERVTGIAADRFKFRTPSLRQVAQTGPWGHDGAFADLEAMVRHHLDAMASLLIYSPEAVLPSRADLDALDNIAHTSLARRQAIANAIEIEAVALNATQIGELMVFLNEGLTDHQCLDLSDTIPMRVPSDLSVAD